VSRIHTEYETHDVNTSGGHSRQNGYGENDFGGDHGRHAEDGDEAEIALINHNNDTCASSHFQQQHMLTSNLNHLTVSEWSPAVVAQWLAVNNLGIYMAVFLDNKIDGETLLELDTSQLKVSRYFEPFTLDLNISLCNHFKIIISRWASEQRTIGIISKPKSTSSKRKIKNSSNCC
jgi:hypothetical protein